MAIKVNLSMLHTAGQQAEKVSDMFNQLAEVFASLPVFLFAINTVQHVFIVFFYVIIT